MNNTEYIEKIIVSVDRILVDTSTLMTNGFQQFISSNKHSLILEQKKIIIPKAVYTELARHIGSDNPEKNERAMAAVELMSLNKDVFQIENVPLSEDEIAHAFADAQLLSELTLHKSEYNQLLITNDRKLSCDAFDLNQQQSCKGRKVLVCYINWYGEMQCCECARHSTDTPEETTLPTLEDITCPNTSEVFNDNSSYIDGSWNFDWKSSVITLCGIGALYALCKNYHFLTKYVKH
ncbi:MAG: hypothetical protein IJX86_00605 [Lachnospiraceae bacterium]|nr:hypothetical protein [Lachnospiraceae bacterium]